MIRLKSLITEAVVTSPDFVAYIKDQEGAVKDSAGMHKAYQDSVGVWTIGYGHTGNVKPGQRWTEKQAEDQLKKDLIDAENKTLSYVQNKFPGSKISTHQIKMLTDFVFNVGSLSKFPKFTTAVVKQNWDDAVKNYKRFAGGRELQRRNQAFYNMFLKPVLSLAKKKPIEQPESGKRQHTTLVGKTLYALPGDPGYATVRDEDYVNNGFINNVVKRVWFPEPIGTAKFAKTGKDGKIWYYVKLSDGSGYGYVRSDVVKTSPSEVYIVKPGDTLLKIALANRLTLDRIKELNNMKNDNIRPGQSIRLIPGITK